MARDQHFQWNNFHGDGHFLAIMTAGLLSLPGVGVSELLKIADPQDSRGV